MSLYLRFHQLKLFLFIFTLQPIRRYIPSSSSLLRRLQSKSVVFLLSDHTSTSRKRTGKKARNWESDRERASEKARETESDSERGRETERTESNSYGNEGRRFLEEEIKPEWLKLAPKPPNPPPPPAPAPASGPWLAASGFILCSCPPIFPTEDPVWHDSFICVMWLIHTL